MKIEGQGGYIEITKQPGAETTKANTTQASSNVKEKAQELIKAIKDQNASTNNTVEDKVNISKEGMMKAENSKNKPSFITISNNQNNSSETKEKNGNPGFFEFVGRVVVGIFTSIFSGEKAETSQSSQQSATNQNKETTSIDIKS